MRGIRYILAQITLLLASTPLPAQPLPLTDEARKFLVYQPAVVHSFTQYTDPAPMFYLHYSHVARRGRNGPAYNLVVQVSRDASVEHATEHCNGLYNGQGPKGATRKRLPGYSCAFVQLSSDGFGSTRYRSTWIAKCRYMVSLGETAVDMALPGEAPIAPLLAGLDAAIAQLPPGDCPGIAPAAPVVADAQADPADRCPPPRSADALGKAIAIDLDDTLAFLKRQLAIKSDAERLCFGVALRHIPAAVDSVAPSYYDALTAQSNYWAALDARKKWFGEQTEIEERVSRSPQYDVDELQMGSMIGIGAIVPAAFLATAVSGYRLALINLRDLVVLPPFHQGLYDRYRRLRAQHEQVEAFDLATQSGSAYHVLVQQMTPLAGAQRLGGEERTALIARYWRTRLEARYQIDQVLAKGPPTEQVKAALAPARRCIGAMRQEVAKCVQDAERAVLGTSR